MILVFEQSCERNDGDLCLGSYVPKGHRGKGADILPLVVQ